MFEIGNISLIFNYIWVNALDYINFIIVLMSMDKSIVMQQWI